MKISIRKIGNTDTVHIEGYVNAVERESRELPPSMAPEGKTDKPFYEVVHAGVFTEAMHREPDVGFMFNHQRWLGSSGGGEIKLKEDSIGLYCSADITDNEVVTAARAGKLRGWSFGFTNEVDDWKDGEDGKRRRYLSKLDLREVSILTETPAYIATTVSVRGDSTDTVTVQYREYPEEVTTAEEPAANDNNNNTARAYRNLYELLRLKGEM